MYQDNSEIDQIIVVQDGTVCIRNSNTVSKNGVEISKTYARMTFAPGSNTSALSENVQSICAAAWTTEVVAAYQSKIAQVA